MTGIPPDEVLPCGCVLRCSVDDGVNVLTIVPCREGCRNVQNAIALAAERRKPVVHRFAP